MQMHESLVQKKALFLLGQRNAICTVAALYHPPFKFSAGQIGHEVPIRAIGAVHMETSHAAQGMVSSLSRSTIVGL
jgi:hypothetical protein